MRIRFDFIRPAPVVFVAAAMLARLSGAEIAEGAAAVEIPGSPVKLGLDGGPTIFPASWLTPEIAASAEPVAASERPRAIAAMAKARSHYPPAFLKAELDSVQLVGELRYSGIVAGGTNSRKTVYIAVGKPEKGFTDAHLVRSFHHEFSSILLRDHPDFLDLSGWKAAGVVSKTTDVRNGVESVKKGRISVRIDPALCEDGFLSAYSRASVEEDFNVFAQYLLTGDKALWDASDRHPRIATKLRLIMNFYRKLDPKFDEAFFLGLAGRKTFAPAAIAAPGPASAVK